MRPYKGGVRHDYKDTTSAEPAEGTRRWSWFALGLAVPLVAVASLLVSEPNQSRTMLPGDAGLALVSAEPPAAAVDTAEADAGETLDAARAVLTGRDDARVAELPAAPEALEAARPGTEIELVVERGDSLERLFRRHDLELSDLAAIVALPEAGPNLKLLKPGDELTIRHDDGNVLSLTRELNAIDMLSVTQQDDGFAAETIKRDVEVRTTTAHGVIETSLFEAAADAGMPDRLTMSMTGIFQWDIDFILDVRRGDEFTVIHEELWRDGEKIRNGEIIAAEFVNRGRSFRAARYETPDGNADYYTPEGRSVRKAFIRAPVSFTRVSANFNPNRRHPILNTIRAHRGVDYAAPTGTPVKAAGDGVVEARGRDGGYGNRVVLRHGGNITTLYAHLSRFGGPGVGGRVEQGDIIGHVGQSGLATGPHLHYEYRVNGVHRNPRTVDLPPAEPVPSEHAEDFRAATASIWRRLDTERELRLADAVE